MVNGLKSPDSIRKAMNNDTDGVETDDGPSNDVDELRTICSEAYQVVGSLLSDLGKFETPEAEKILDNLSQQRLVHKDVLPWESYERGVNPSRVGEK
jgi:hypothetical protein